MYSYGFSSIILSCKNTTIGSPSKTAKCTNFEIRGSKQLNISFVMHEIRGKCRSSSPLTTRRSSKNIRRVRNFKSWVLRGRKTAVAIWTVWGPSLHNYGSIPMTDWHRRFVRLAYHVFFLSSLLTWITLNVCIFCSRFPLIESQVLTNYIITHPSTDTRRKKPAGFVKDLNRHW